MSYSQQYIRRKATPAYDRLGWIDGVNEDNFARYAYLPVIINNKKKQHTNRTTTTKKL